jgi:hypothetical protein
VRWSKTASNRKLLPFDHRTLRVPARNDVVQRLMLSSKLVDQLSSFQCIEFARMPFANYTRDLKCRKVWRYGCVWEPLEFHSSLGTAACLCREASQLFFKSTQAVLKSLMHLRQLACIAATRAPNRNEQVVFEDKHRICFLAGSFSSQARLLEGGNFPARTTRAGSAFDCFRW